MNAWQVTTVKKRRPVLMNADIALALRCESHFDHKGAFYVLKPDIMRVFF